MRGPWPDETLQGWWGDEPPYHVPTFVLTHHARPSVEMKGSTTFFFVTNGIHAALERARAAAGGQDVRIGGGVSTVRHDIEADSIKRFTSPYRTLLGRGERFFAGPICRSEGSRSRSAPRPSSQARGTRAKLVS